MKSALATLVPFLQAIHNNKTFEIILFQYQISWISQICCIKVSVNGLNVTGLSSLNCTTIKQKMVWLSCFLEGLVTLTPYMGLLRLDNETDQDIKKLLKALHYILDDNQQYLQIILKSQEASNSLVLSVVDGELRMKR